MMLSFLYTTTVAILLALNYQATGSNIPQMPRIYDYGGLFAKNRCQLKSVSDVTCYLEWTVNDGWIKKNCPLGTKFIESACQCLAVPEFYGGYSVQNNEAESASPSSKQIDLRPAVCQLKATENRATYLESVEGRGFITRTCPKGTAFNSQECGCTTIVSESSDSEIDDDDSDEETSPVVVKTTKIAPTKEVVSQKKVYDSNVPCNKKSAEKNTFYMELVHGHGWLTRPCPVGTVFNTVECECIKKSAAAKSTSESPKAGSASQETGSQQETTGRVEQKKTFPDVGRVCTRITDVHKGFYVQLIAGRKWVRVACADGTIFSALHCQCIEIFRTTQRVGDSSSSEESDSSEETDGIKTTPEICKMKADNVNNRYQELVEGYGWISRPCPDGTTFSVKACRCTLTAPGIGVKPTQPAVAATQPKSTTTTAPCTRKPSHTKTLYRQMVSDGQWVLMKCAKGTVYSAQICGCALPIGGKVSSADSGEDSSVDSDEDSGLDNSNVDSSEEVPTAEPETASGKEIVCNKRPADQITRYQEFVQGFGWITRDCAIGTRFDRTTCTCSTAHPIKIGSGSKVTASPKISTAQKEETPCESVNTLLPVKIEGDQTPVTSLCLKKPSVNPRFYFELSGNSIWINRLCPTGTAFVSQQCRCSPISIFSQDTDSSDEYVDQLGQRSSDSSLFEKMLAKKIFEQSNNFQLKATNPSFHHHSSFTRSPTQRKYATVKYPNYRIS